MNEQNEYNANGNPASNVFVAASEWGKGRVIGYAHDGLIRDAVHRNCYSSNDVARCEKTTPKTETADNLTFIDNALRWAMGPTPADCPTKTITIAIYEGWVKMPETQEIADLAKRRDWSYERILPTADEFKPRMRVNELIASPDNRGVAGVRFEDTHGTPGSLAADLVVDASGRASPTLRFLEAIGSAKPPTIEIGIDQAYATAIFEKPEDAPTDWLFMLHVPTPPSSSRLGIIAPMEGRRWSVSLCANHGEAPPGDIDGFMAFAKSFRMPTIYNAIRGAKRVGDIARFGMPCSVLRAFDKLDRFPRGLVPLGDSVCRFPPVQGQGMSVAAQECCVLASFFEARRGRDDPLDGLAEAFFTEIQPLLETPWGVAMADLVYPQTRGERPPDFENKLQYTHALMRLAAEDAEADKILAEVRSLLKPQSALREPELASRVMSMMAPA